MSSAIDLHMHTVFSDGSDTLPELLEKLTAAGIRAFSVTDHDTVDGALEMEKLVPPELRYVRGVELSCRSPEGKCHILGYGYDPEDPLFRHALEEGSRLRREKLDRRISFLEESCAIRFTPEELDWLYSQESPGKPHLGQLLVKRGMAGSIDEAIRTLINPCKGGRDRIDAELAVRAILHAGGVPVWAHPLGGEGERRLSREEFSAQLEYLVSQGIRGLEAFYSRYDREDEAFLLEEAERRGLPVSGGSDYHGKNKKGLSLGMLCADGGGVDPEKITLCKHLHISV